MSLEQLGANLSSFVTFILSVWRGQIAVEMLLESVGLRCGGVSFWFMIFNVGWVEGRVSVPFVMNSWILFSCAGFFRSFLVIPDGFESLWSGSPLRHVSITNQDEQILLQDKNLIAWRAMWTDIVFFWQSPNSTCLSLLHFFLFFFFF